MYPRGILPRTEGVQMLQPIYLESSNKSSCSVVRDLPLGSSSLLVQAPGTAFALPQINHPFEMDRRRVGRVELWCASGRFRKLLRTDARPGKSRPPVLFLQLPHRLCVLRPPLVSTPFLQETVERIRDMRIVWNPDVVEHAHPHY